LLDVHAHAYRTQDYEGVKDFEPGCMRTYLILKEKPKQWNADQEVREIIERIEAQTKDTPAARKGAAILLGYSFDKARISKKRLSHQRLDQITVDILLGVQPTLLRRFADQDDSVARDVP